MKKHLYSIIFSIVLTACTTYTLLDAFVIPHYEKGKEYETSSYVNTENETEITTTKEKGASGEVSVTDNSYEDENIKITLTTLRIANTNVYVADVFCDPSYINTALAQDAFGTNITQKTSVMAKNANAILAINGDYYGANKQGYVIKNGVLYRSTSRSSKYEDLVIYADGSFGLIKESEISAKELLNAGVINLFAFGPTLVNNGTVAVSSGEEVGKSMSSNPRTAIGIVENGHYIFVVSDGRTSESNGLSLYQLANVMKDYGCVTAYNLDGGGSSTMYFNGQLINNPTTSGKNISERAVSDIVYIGY